jgi:hypothetical protein
MGNVLSRDLITMPTEVGVSCLPTYEGFKYKAQEHGANHGRYRTSYSLYCFLMNSGISITLMRYVHSSGHQTHNPNASILSL